MKSIIIMLLLAASMSNMAFAQKIQANKVPAIVNTSFKAKFPAATKISWEVEKENEYEAEFVLTGEKVSASFNDKGNWIETETEIKISALPSAIQDIIRKDFPGYKTEEACKVESAKDGSCFEAEIEKGEETYELLFSANGKLLSKKTEKKEGKN